MKPTTLTPATVLLGAWIEANRAAITGALRTTELWTEVALWGGDVRTDALAVTGQPWPALRQALETAQFIGAAHVLILTNDASLVKALSRPFRAPQPCATKRHYFGKGDYIDAGYGGDANQWAVYQLLGGVWGGNWAIKQVYDLKGARELWQAQR